MRTSLLLPLTLLTWLAAVPAQAAGLDVDLSIRTPGMSLYIGDRDPRGRYWDGGRWRDERWWNDNCHRYQGKKDFRGHCGPHPGGGKKHRHEGHCPPGQARKGHC
ncbi:DUF2502 domain-containing protein [Zoogloea sp.]|uniref:DUF2502 domain-containing protein n=1 Tax=Zoogloea sp. TaxID=49181 RepID=UPI00261D8489|nr:DUF2502 domain-containing protein [Zoogloea sp.]MDD3353310.1 DUF2502 domain-containing protein [Zoogloea sp.]